MDFTIKIYIKLLHQLMDAEYQFQTFAEFLNAPAKRVVLLRHDVEKKYPNALIMAKIQHDLKIKGSYYFRILKNHYNEDIIQQISILGHEVGYHYDDLSFCKGNYEVALERFLKNLSMLREIVPVHTICMEGAPLSKYDNRELWRKYNYRDFGIIGEPYFDLNSHAIMYFTDTGRRWDGKLSLRDKLNEAMIVNDSQNGFIYNPVMKSTHDFISVINLDKLSDKVMITVHPQRWNEQFIPWIRELITQNFKNQIKKYYIKQS